MAFPLSSLFSFLRPIINPIQKLISPVVSTIGHLLPVINLASVLGIGASLIGRFNPIGLGASLINPLGDGIIPISPPDPTFLPVPSPILIRPPPVLPTARAPPPAESYIYPPSDYKPWLSQVPSSPNSSVQVARSQEGLAGLPVDQESSLLGVTTSSDNQDLGALQQLLESLDVSFEELAAEANLDLQSLLS